MEAYFHNDPRIEVWLKQITEKLFTVCLLTGVDAEVEFQKGCQIVAKLTHLLQGISIFPSEYFEDGLKQLLEQQLPDSRVINNFSTFQDTMYKMLHEGMNKASNIGNAVNDELDTEYVISALASVNSRVSDLGETEVEFQALKFDELKATMKAKKKDSSSVTPSSLASSNLAKPYGIKRKTEISEQAYRLQQVLNTIFPSVSVCWNLNLMGQTFLAQVEDILIYLHNPEQPCPVENFSREGWKVYICSSNDLMFPRRLERGLRQIQRTGKKCKNG